MKARHPSLLLLLPVLATLHQPTAAHNGITTDAGCSPATCGNLTLAYPFWLAGQDRFSSGPPAFRLTCMDSAAGAFLSTSYMKVLNIDYGSRSLITLVTVQPSWPPTRRAACTVMFDVSSAFAITDRFSISRRNRELSDCTFSALSVSLSAAASLVFTCVACLLERDAKTNPIAVIPIWSSIDYLIAWLLTFTSIHRVLQFRAARGSCPLCPTTRPASRKGSRRPHRSMHNFLAL